MFNFLNQQISMLDAMALDRVVQLAAKPGMHAVELGTFTGRSTLAMLPYIKQHGGRMTCVDWFKGNEGLGEEVDLTQGYATANVLDVVRRNFQLGGFEDCVNVIVGKTQDVAPTMQDGFADLIFVDADHRYTGVRQDIIDWYPKLKEGGIMCGHDFEQPMDRCDLQRVMAHCEVDFMDGMHYGVIRAVSEFFPDAQQEGVVWWITKKTGAYPKLEEALAAAKATHKPVHVGPMPTELPGLQEFFDRYDLNSLYTQSAQAYQSGDLLNALRGAMALTQRFPSFVPGWRLTHQICLDTGDEETADAQLALAIQKAGLSPELLSMVGVRKHQRGDKAGAVEAFQAALMPNIDGLLNLGHSHLGLQQHAEAITCFQMVLQLNPRELDAHLGQAEAHLRLGQWEAYDRAMAKAKQIDPEALVLAQLEQLALELKPALHA